MNTDAIIVVILLAVTLGGLTWLERHSRKSKPVNNKYEARAALNIEQVREVKSGRRNPDRRRYGSIEKMKPRLPVR